MNSGVYRIEINNRFYIGVSVDLAGRFRKHKWLLNNNKHYNKKLQNAYNKYQNLSFSVVETTDSWLYEKEIMWIDRYNSFLDGYNLNEGGEGGSGYKHTPATIKILKQNRNDSCWWSGRKHTDETKQLLREKNTGINNPCFGRRQTDEEKEKKSLALRGKKNHQWKGVEDELLINLYRRHKNYAKVGRIVGLSKSQVHLRITKLENGNAK